MKFIRLKFFWILFSLISCNLPIETDKLDSYVVERLESGVLTSYFQSINGVGDFTRVKTNEGGDFIFIKLSRSNISKIVDVLNKFLLDNSLIELTYNLNLGIEVKKILGGNSNYSGVWSDGICQTNSKDSLIVFKPKDLRKLFLTDQFNNPVQIHFKDDDFKINKIKQIQIESLHKKYLIKIAVESSSNEETEKRLKKERERILNEINR